MTNKREQLPATKERGDTMGSFFPPGHIFIGF